MSMPVDPALARNAARVRLATAAHQVRRIDENSPSGQAERSELMGTAITEARKLLTTAFSPVDAERGLEELAAQASCDFVKALASARLGNSPGLASSNQQLNGRSS